MTKKPHPQTWVKVNASSWQDLSEFVFGYFGPTLTRALGDRVDICVRVTEAGNIRAELCVRPDSFR